MYATGWSCTQRHLLRNDGVVNCDVTFVFLIFHTSRVRFFCSHRRWRWAVGSDSCMFIFSPTPPLLGDIFSVRIRNKNMYFSSNFFFLLILFCVREISRTLETTFFVAACSIRTFEASSHEVEIRCPVAHLDWFRPVPGCPLVVVIFPMTVHRTHYMMMMGCAALVRTLDKVSAIF